MPLDVLHEILGYLTPRELINVYETNKLFSTTLDHPDSKTIWMEARKQFDAPEPPQGFTEAQWSRLLFVAKCQNCGASNIQEVDWNILKRLCSRCKLEHLAGERDKGFKVSMGILPKEIFELLPCTNKRPYSRETRDPNYHTRKLYFEPDAHAVAKRWNVLNAAADSPGGKATFENWKARRRGFVASCAHTAQAYEEWEAAYLKQKGDETYETLKLRKEAVIQRFIVLGYTRADVEGAFDLRPQYANGTANVTDRVWKTLRPKLEPVVKSVQARREHCEKIPLIQSRMKILDDLYDEYLDGLKPAIRYPCPRPSFLHALPDVWQVLDKPSDVSVGAQDFEFIVNQFPDLIASFQRDLKEKVTKTVTSAPPDDTFNLAKNVFRCEKAVNQGWGGDYWMTSNGVEQIMLGWVAVGSHRCVPGTTPVPDHAGGAVVAKAQCEITMHKEASRLAATLITMAGLDPARATLAEMDARDTRFAIAFESMPYSWTTEYPVFTWRGALHHFAEEYHKWLSDPPKFRLATAEELEEARHHSASLLETCKAWACNHCQEFFDKERADTRPVILKHLKERHEIAEPVAGEDYLVNPYLWPRLEAPCKRPLQFISDVHFRCRKCSSATRLFDLQGVQAHFQQVHHSLPVPGQDYGLSRESVTGYPS